MTTQPRQYRKKPVVIEAVRFRASEPGEPLEFDHLPAWLDEALDNGTLERRSGDATNRGDWDFIAVKTLEGEMLCAPDDYLIRGVQREIYPCKPDIFAATYEAVDQ